MADVELQEIELKGNELRSVRHSLEMQEDGPAEPSQGQTAAAWQPDASPKPDAPSAFPYACIMSVGIITFAGVIISLMTLLSVENITKRPWQPFEPPLQGIYPGTERPHIILAQDIDYPPYAYLGDATKEFAVDGIGYDIAMRLNEVCDINVTVVESRWKNCWDAGEIGAGLLNGWFHGCMTYTHTVGQRNRFVEFSEPILQLNKPGGLISRLDPSTGKPVVNGKSSLKEVKVIDVVGWAPTADGLHFVKNRCDGEKPFSGFEMVDATHSTGNANDDALLTLLDGSADAIWIYADQAKNYQCDPKIDSKSWNCTMWTEGFGRDFAYVQTGMYSYAYGGTTLSMAKKGSGLKKILDPCIQKFKNTSAYYEVCKENKAEHSCFKNKYFPADADDAKAPYETETNLLKTACSDGYCPCTA